MADPQIHDSIVIGAGQAGLSAAHHLQRLGIEHLVLDANAHPGGAWQHRWDALTMGDVHGVADLPEAVRPPAPEDARANVAVPEYFAAYEEGFVTPVIRPVEVAGVEPAELPDGSDGFVVKATTDAGPQTWHTRTLVNATGTWTRPFVPYYPGIDQFAGRQLHTVEFPGPEHFRGHRTVVVGGGASAVQFLGMLAPIVGADQLVWVTRTPPDFRDETFTRELGAAAVAQVAARVEQGLPPRSVVSVTGLHLRPQEEQARRLGVYRRRRPMFSRIEPTGVRWDDPEPGGTAFEEVDTILWATGFRPAIEHLAPLRLRTRYGGIQLAADGTTAVADPRVQLVGYGPSASTIGGNRAGRQAALGIRRALADPRPLPASTPTAADVDEHSGRGSYGVSGARA
ncbi:MAG TPA: NAD(P)/FAD-dependent oxidoreductase [Candidatus Avipropionibacterium avicola]|uniref:NAD(P)/FAD-dependent oxidoreductase n=1 Tax=Candidatus Avipropionibacterium avicola TaxID=2840701 RepID=A0A9D1KPZ3_9ACTN|nr:NAD(P)/FAD-dependent oxidoreductase [Candidatus Avipropionibacterium avicola]